MDGWSYTKAGVDLDKVRKAHKAIATLIESTYKFREGLFGRIIRGAGHYAALIDIGGGKALALHADGVGTKVLIAQLMDRYNTVGIDCVAMNVNDLVCVGAEPIAMIDYLVMERSDDELAAEIIKGLVRGAEMAGIAIVGGETAIMPDVVKGSIEGKGFDLAGLSIGVVDLDKLILGDKIQPRDCVIGISSSGIHSNGLTLARKVLLESSRLSVHSYVEELGHTIGEELLKPTLIYTKPVLEMLRRGVEVHGLAHITGGAFTKLMRIAPRGLGFRLDSMPEPPPIFKLIQRLGNITSWEMYRTFNMGIGFCVIVPEHEAEVVTKIFESHGFKAQQVGTVVDKPHVEIVSKDETLTYH
ncbi:MAG: phosphoribosylformylglycinamidine cyclo-ligase [Candidatus Nezhaarchaeota archaeon]|nr:phosphoribosylformylglycinamidine cyclo-ligase [Candidatus Nezhaarchaeota archaeon]MCX8141424.1 phosphoribosylformylglycinamidine cyclo-ligase [Candidatus Nezhaarchaeota archaeon]MDW8049690.1 phosphoribosylformylglycinamidine cyclo-ligase [Nitrososphaerota archaeon]